MELKREQEMVWVTGARGSIYLQKQGLRGTNTNVHTLYIYDDGAVIESEYTAM